MGVHDVEQIRDIERSLLGIIGSVPSTQTSVQQIERVQQVESTLTAIPLAA